MGVNTTKLSNILLLSKDIKRMICDRVDSYGINITRLCEKHGIDKLDFTSTYINCVSEVLPKVTEKQLTGLMNDLGLTVTLMVKVRDIDYSKLNRDLMPIRKRVKNKIKK